MLATAATTVKNLTPSDRRGVTKNVIVWKPIDILGLTDTYQWLKFVQMIL